MRVNNEKLYSVVELSKVCTRLNVYRLRICQVPMILILRSDAYAEGWDRIFGKKENTTSTAKVDPEAVVVSGAGTSK